MSAPKGLLGLEHVADIYSEESGCFAELSPEDLRRAGISPGLVRLSIGYTGSLEQRWDQLVEALRLLGMIR